MCYNHNKVSVQTYAVHLSALCSAYKFWVKCCTNRFLWTVSTSLPLTSFSCIKILRKKPMSISYLKQFLQNVSGYRKTPWKKRLHALRLFLVTERAVTWFCVSLPIFLPLQRTSCWFARQHGVARNLCWWCRRPSSCWLGNRRFRRGC